MQTVLTAMEDHCRWLQLIYRAGNVVYVMYYILRTLFFFIFYVSCNLFVLINFYRDRTTRLRTIRYSHAYYTMQISI